MIIIIRIIAIIIKIIIRKLDKNKAMKKTCMIKKKCSLLYFFCIWYYWHHEMGLSGWESGWGGLIYGDI